MILFPSLHRRAFYSAILKAATLHSKYERTNNLIVGHLSSAHGTRLLITVHSLQFTAYAAYSSKNSATYTEVAYLPLPHSAEWCYETKGICQIHQAPVI